MHLLLQFIAYPCITTVDFYHYFLFLTCASTNLLWRSTVPSLHWVGLTLVFENTGWWKHNHGEERSDMGKLIATVVLYYRFYTDISTYYYRCYHCYHYFTCHSAHLFLPDKTILQDVSSHSNNIQNKYPSFAILFSYFFSFYLFNFLTFFHFFHFSFFIF